MTHKNVLQTFCYNNWHLTRELITVRNQLLGHHNLIEVQGEELTRLRRDLETYFTKETV
jgi:hypothetical protein